MSTIAYRLLGSAAFGLGFLGIFLPLLPTVPLWILAAWSYARSAPHLRDRIYAHPRFGKQVHDFLEHSVLSRRGKLFALLGITFGVSLSLLLLELPLIVEAAIGASIVVVITFLMTRPESVPSPTED